MDGRVLDELKRWVGWGTADEAALRALHQHAAPHFVALSDAFYDAVLGHPSARAVITGGEAQVERLKQKHRGWLGELLGGPWEEAWLEARGRIGRVHVEIDLAQHHMFGAMNVVRRELGALIETAPGPESQRTAMRTALGRVLDLELSVMLHTYREDSLARQARAERLSTFGQLAGAIGHDLRNPLGVIEGSAHLLGAHAAADERVQRQVERIRQQVGVASGIIDHVLDLIRDRPLARLRVPLGALLESAAASVSRPAGVGYASDGVRGLDAEGDPVQLRQVLVNLLTNAVEAVGPEGAVVVRGRLEGGSVLLAVEDTGPGVAPEAAARLFEPLVTTKARGVGLGLALVKRTVERHGGTIAYRPRRGGGASFLLSLPCAPQAPGGPDRA